MLGVGSLNPSLIPYASVPPYLKSGGGLLHQLINFSITLAPSPPSILFKHGLPTGDKHSIALVHVIINVTLNEIWAARNLATFENLQQPASATIRKVKHRLRQRIRAAYNFNNIPVFKKTWGHKQVLCKIENQTLQVLI